MPRWPALALVVLAFAIAFPGWALAEPAAEAKAALSKMHAEMIAILRQEKSDPTEKRALVEHFLISNLDLTRMAAEALGTHLQAMSKREFADFSEEYSHYLTHLYTREISWVKADGAGFEIVDAKVDPKTGEVSVETRAPTRPSMANVAPRRTQRYRGELEGLYVLKERRGRWKIVSIRLNGVDLNRVFGEQFASILEDQSPEVLIEKLQLRNEENRSKNPF